MTDLRTNSRPGGIYRMETPAVPEVYFEWDENSKALSVVYLSIGGAREVIWPNCGSEQGAKLLVLMWTKGFNTHRNHVRLTTRNALITGG